MPHNQNYNEIDGLNLIRDEIQTEVESVLTQLSGSDEVIDLPLPVEFSEDLVIEKQQAKDIARTVKRGLVEKQLLIAVNKNPREKPIEVGYIQPPHEQGKFISAIISPDFQIKISDKAVAIKDAIIQMHTLDLISAILGVKLVSHGIDIDRIVYSVDLG